ncbi:MAG: hypothetical protein HYZ68_06820, partial [Chloroflexi bacterium]|nr:hypothetical protein [Chloroflexota bacterium]
LAYKLSILLPPWYDETLWFNVILRAFFLPFDAGSFGLLYLLGRRLLDPIGALRVAWSYALLLVPLEIFLGWFDVLPLFFMLLALYATLLGRAHLSALSMGIGFMTKVFPLLVLPLAWRRLRSAQRVPFTLLLSGSILLLAFPFVLINPQYFLASLRVNFERSSWESIWALLEGYPGFGQVAYLPSRFEVDMAAWQVHPSSLPWPGITLAFVFLFLFLYTRRFDWQGDGQGVVFTGLTLNLVLLWSRGFSPQFIGYLFPFILLGLPPGRGLAYSFLFSFLFFAEWPVSVFLSWDPGFVSLWIVGRTLLLIVLSLDYLFILWPPQGRVWVALQRWSFPATTALLLLAGLGGSAYGLQVYSRLRLDVEPLKPVIETLRDERLERSTVVVAPNSVYRRLYPYVRDGVDFYVLPVLESKFLHDSYPQLEVSLARRPTLWWIYDASRWEGDEGSRIDAWLSQRACRASASWYENTYAARYVTEIAPAVAAQQAEFGEGIRLAAFGVAPNVVSPGQGLCVSLRWRASQSIEEDYTVFVHLVGPQGLVAQNDQPPVGGFRPTSSWTATEEILDYHGLIIPPDAPLGRYELRAGLYAASGERLPMIDEKGQAHGDYVVLGQVEVSG